MYYEKMDRLCEYKNNIYVVLEVLASEMVLVVKKEDLNKAEYPMPVSIIPEDLVKNI